MCGFLVEIKLSKFNELNQFNNGLQTISHRGPDYQGVWNDSNIRMGHTRLSIIDLSVNANQPFKYDNYVIVYNGEVFNYIELRNELSLLGYEFTTSSDTEVVICSYIEWGEECVKKFNGMWAFVIYNITDTTIFASRDRFGMKPFFLYESQQNIIFSSEIEPFTKFKNDLSINYNEIRKFIREGSHENIGDTFFNEIKELSPAHNIYINNKREISILQYWQYPSKNKRTISNKVINEFEDLLSDSISVRLRADVDLSILLSGGVDSTIIVGEAVKKLKNKKLKKAYCYASQDNKDESKYAISIANKLNLDIEIIKQEKLDIDYINRLKFLIKRLGRGHSSPAIVGVSHIYEYIRKRGSKIALDGQGADELLGGYTHYYITLAIYYIKKLKFRLFYELLIDQYKFGIKRSVILWFRNIMPETIKYHARKFYGYEKYLSNHRIDIKHTKFNTKYSKNRHKDKFNEYLIEQHKIGLVNLLYYGDIVSMAYSVENRSPFMDHRLVEYSFETDGFLKVQGRINKYVLRKHSLYNYFREELERSKIGFNTPITDKTKIEIINILKNSSILKWPIFTQKLRSDLNNNSFFHIKFERILFRLIQVHLWNEIYIENND